MASADAAAENSRPTLSDQVVQLAAGDVEASRAKMRAGVMLFDRNALRGAAAAFEEAIRLDPDNPAAHFMLAETYARLGRFDEAAREYRKTIEVGRGTKFAADAEVLLPGIEAEAKARRAETAKRKKEERQLKARLRDLDRQAKQARLTTTPGAVFRDCDVCPEMVVVPAGSFMMGSEYDTFESPRHRVSITRAFAVGKFEVTFAEWDACLANGGCLGNSPDDKGWGRHRRPVINISWREAMDYVEWISRRTGQRYRLLSEAEWEYACRAGSTTAYSFGDDSNALREYAWHSLRFGGESRPVGERKPNAFGLYDMHGNVAEWVSDPWHWSYEGAPNYGEVWEMGGDQESRTRRGGSWEAESERSLRCSSRNRDSRDGRYHYIGFRLARTLD